MLLKLVRDEPESGALRDFLTGADVVSCELVRTEVPRAIRRAAAHDPRLPLEVLLGRAGEILDDESANVPDQSLPGGLRDVRL